MKYTGIRAVPQVTPRRIMQPHLARYEFSTQAIGHADSALDIACGTGYGTFILKSKGGYKKVLGADLDWPAVEYATNTYHKTDHIHFIQSNGCCLPFGENSLELITCFETFEHILDSEGFLRELCRILKPDGVLVISIPNAPMWAPFSSPPNLEADPIRLGLGHKHNFEAKQFLKLLTGYFGVVIPYGQDFRKASGLSKVFRQLERVVIFLKYRLAEYPLIRRKLRSLLTDVLAQEDLAVRDTQWKVKEWKDLRVEPIFCVAVCKEKQID